MWNNFNSKIRNGGIAILNTIPYIVSREGGALLQMSTIPLSTIEAQRIETIPNAWEFAIDRRARTSGNHFPIS